MHTNQSVRFDDWKAAIQQANDIDRIMHVIRSYLGVWSAEELRTLPTDVGTLTVETAEDIIVRAVLASRAELTAPPQTDTRLLREMSLTFSAAAARLRQLMANNAPRPAGITPFSLKVLPTDIDLRFRWPYGK